MITSSATTSEKDKWTKTQYSNLYRYEPSGVYHVRAKVCGKLLRRSLGTKSLEIAQKKLVRFLEDERTRLGKNPRAGVLFSGLAKQYEDAVNRSPGLKPRAKEYRVETLNQIKRTSAEFWGMLVSEIGPEHCRQLADALRDKYSPTRYNGTIETLRAVLAMAVEQGLLVQNHAANIERVSVPIVAPHLPEADDFDKLLARLDDHPQSQDAAAAVRLLYLTGSRISAAQKLMPKDIDWDRNEVLLPPVKYDDKPVRLPMFPALRQLLKTLMSQYPGVGPLMPIASPRIALANASRKLGLPHLTPHKLRHLFATRCIESNVDIRTIAAWLGHKDGGALLLKRYAHLRNEHSQKMAKKVKF